LIDVQREGREHEAANHRRAAIALLTRLEEIAELRETFDVVREKHVENGKDLDEIEELMMGQEEERVRDDARALGIFADEYECDCGCSEGKDLGYEDEEKALHVEERWRRARAPRHCGRPSRSRPMSRSAARASTRRPRRASCRAFGSEAACGSNRPRSVRTHAAGAAGERDPDQAALI
jgi:hypothetical protein